MNDENKPKVTATARVLKYEGREPDGSPDEVIEREVDITDQFSNQEIQQMKENQNASDK